jgi:VCBS repeat-containing protein
MIEGTDASHKITVDRTPATGAAQHWSVSGAFGKELPVVGANPNADTYVFKRINATTIEAQYLKDGKPTTKQTLVISSDGKTLTVTASGTNAQGQTVHNVVVYSK